MNKITKSFLTAFAQANQRLNLDQSKMQLVKTFVEGKAYHFHFIHRDQQAYGKVRAYRKSILESMRLANSPTIQVIGDSARFGDGRVAFAQQILFKILDSHPKHHILYGMTGQSGDVNALVSDWIADDPEKQARVIGNAVSVHTPMAINSWGCDVGDIRHVTVVYPKALFGDDVGLSDYFVPQYDDAPGASMGLCLEGGVQSFLQAITMLELDVPILAVEKLRGSTNPSCKLDGNYVLFFSAAEFLSLIKKSVTTMHAEGRKITREEIEKICNTYIHNPAIHGPYSFATHKHLHVFANPGRLDFNTKIGLFVKAFDKFFEHRLWEKLDLLRVINYEEELENRTTATSVSALVSMRDRTCSPIHSRTLNQQIPASGASMALPAAKL
ncbi:MAG: hypothetical protein ACHP65_02315 [Legionellales bacterium]